MVKGYFGYKLPVTRRHNPEKWISDSLLYETKKTRARKVVETVKKLPAFFENRTTSQRPEYEL
jgi:hypothetical protein